MLRDFYFSLVLALMGVLDFLFNLIMTISGDLMNIFQNQEFVTMNETLKTIGMIIAPILIIFVAIKMIIGEREPLKAYKNILIAVALVLIVPQMIEKTVEVLPSLNNAVMGENISKSKDMYITNKMADLLIELNPETSNTEYRKEADYVNTKDKIETGVTNGDNFFKIVAVDGKYYMPDLNDKYTEHKPLNPSIINSGLTSKNVLDINETVNDPGWFDMPVYKYSIINPFIFILVFLIMAVGLGMAAFKVLQTFLELIVFVIFSGIMPFFKMSEDTEGFFKKFIQEFITAFAAIPLQIISVMISVSILDFLLKLVDSEGNIIARTIETVIYLCAFCWFLIDGSNTIKNSFGVDVGVRGIGQVAGMKYLSSGGGKAAVGGAKLGAKGAVGGVKLGAKGANKSANFATGQINGRGLAKEENSIKKASENPQNQKSNNLEKLNNFEKQKNSGNSVKRTSEQPLTKGVDSKNVGNPSGNKATNTPGKTVGSTSNTIGQTSTKPDVSGTSIRKPTPTSVSSTDNVTTAKKNNNGIKQTNQTSGTNSIKTSGNSSVTNGNTPNKSVKSSTNTGSNIQKTPVNKGVNTNSKTHKVNKTNVKKTVTTSTKHNVKPKVSKNANRKGE